MEEAIANEQAAALDGDASDDGSFEFEPMDELELAEADDANDPAANDPAANARNAQNAQNARNAGTAVSTKRKRAAQTATPKAARKASRGPTSK
ncbi:MAG: hypothetical protein ABGY24_03570, partial [bacterium]